MRPDLTLLAVYHGVGQAEDLDLRNRKLLFCCWLWIRKSLHVNRDPAIVDGQVFIDGN